MPAIRHARRSAPSFSTAKAPALQLSTPGLRSGAVCAASRSGAARVDYGGNEATTPIRSGHHHPANSGPKGHHCHDHGNRVQKGRANHRRPTGGFGSTIKRLCEEKEQDRARIANRKTALEALLALPDRETLNNFAALFDPDSVHYLGERLTRAKYDESAPTVQRQCKTAFYIARGEAGIYFCLYEWMAELKTRIWHLDPATNRNSRSDHAAKFPTTAELVEQVALTLPALGDWRKQQSTAKESALVVREQPRGKAKPWTADRWSNSSTTNDRRQAWRSNNISTGQHRNRRSPLSSSAVPRYPRHRLPQPIHSQHCPPPRLSDSKADFPTRATLKAPPLATTSERSTARAADNESNGEEEPTG
uniref:DUF222 domain-containing protein n=1 Tax=Globodera pallida TaxID=36090 RepID=A0A183BUB3_GLOPA